MVAVLWNLEGEGAAVWGARKLDEQLLTHECKEEAEAETEQILSVQVRKDKASLL